MEIPELQFLRGSFVESGLDFTIALTYAGREAFTHVTHLQMTVYVLPRQGLASTPDSLSSSCPHSV
jgi:hypothetical protein